MVLAFIYVPLGVVAINSFNSDRTFGWPPPGLTTQWWSAALQAPGPRDALRTSVEAGLGATAIALVLGSLLALALTRYRFFGRNAISLLVILPIALPGIVTGIALQSVIQNLLNPVFGINAGLFTIIVGHATFCVVVIFNNVTARLRRMGGSLESASADLGARPFTTFRLVTFPLLRYGRPCGRPAGVRPQLRRDRGHDVHRGTGHAHPADLDLQQPVPAEPGARGQRRRRDLGGGLDPAGLARPAAQRRGGRGEPPLIRAAWWPYWPTEAQAQRELSAGSARPSLARL